MKTVRLITSEMSVYLKQSSESKLLISRSCESSIYCSPFAPFYLKIAYNMNTFIRSWLKWYVYNKMLFNVKQKWYSCLWCWWVCVVYTLCTHDLLTLGLTVCNMTCRMLTLNLAGTLFVNFWNVCEQVTWWILPDVVMFVCRLSWRCGTRLARRTTTVCGRSPTPTPMSSSCASPSTVLTVSRTSPRSGRLKWSTFARTCPSSWWATRRICATTRTRSVNWWRWNRSQCDQRRDAPCLTRSTPTHTSSARPRRKTASERCLKQPPGRHCRWRSERRAVVCFCNAPPRGALVSGRVDHCCKECWGLSVDWHCVHEWNESLF